MQISIELRARALLYTTTTTLAQLQYAVYELEFGSSCDGYSFLSLTLFCCSYYVTLGENFKAKPWEKKIVGSDYPKISLPQASVIESPLHGLQQ